MVILSSLQHGGSYIPDTVFSSIDANGLLIDLHDDAGHFFVETAVIEGYRLTDAKLNGGCRDLATMIVFQTIDDQTVQTAKLCVVELIDDGGQSGKGFGIGFGFGIHQIHLVVVPLYGIIIPHQTTM